MPLKQVIAPAIKKLLAEKNIFDYFWQLPKNWVEPPNYRRGGWSGVITHRLNGEQIDNQMLFVKLQSNSVFKTFKRPYSGLPTFYREFLNTQKAKKAGVNVLDFVYYGQRGLDAILVSKSLEGYLELNQALTATEEQSMLREHLIQALADNLVKLHKANISHGSLYQKHVFVKLVDANTIDLRFIDFEKSRRASRKKCIVRDLYTLFKSTDGLTMQERDFILDKYAAEFSERKIQSFKQKIAELTRRKAEQREKKYGANTP